MDSEPTSTQQTIDELRNQATSQEDHAYLDAEQAKLDAERKQALGGEVVESTKLVSLPDGSIATEAEVQASQARGEEKSGVYSGGIR